MPSKFSEKASTKCLFVASAKYYVSVYIVGFKLVLSGRKHMFKESNERTRYDRTNLYDRFNIFKVYNKHIRKTLTEVDV